MVQCLVRRCRATEPERVVEHSHGVAVSLGHAVPSGGSVIFVTEATLSMAAHEPDEHPGSWSVQTRPVRTMPEVAKTGSWG